MDHEAVDQAGHLCRRVVGDNAGVREHDPLDRAVRDVSLMPEGHVLEACDEVAAQHPRETCETLGGYRVSFVRHCRRALLAGCERFLDLADLGPLQMPEFC